MSECSNLISALQWQTLQKIVGGGQQNGFQEPFNGCKIILIVEKITSVDLLSHFGSLTARFHINL